MAEGGRFELPNGLPLPVFKTGAFSRTRPPLPWARGWQVPAELGRFPHMSRNYKLYTMYNSPYSDKIRMLMYYKSIPFDEYIENAETRFSVLQARTGRTMVPVFIAPDDTAMNDSTRMAAYFEANFPTPATRWEETGIDTLAMLLEDYADEWLVRIMLASRWYHQADADQNAAVIGYTMTHGVFGLDLQRAARDFPPNIIATVPKMGATPENAEAWYGLFQRNLLAMEQALAHDDFLSGSAPHLCDFAFYGMINQIRRDPTGYEWINEGPQSVRGWLESLEARVKAGKDATARDDVESAEQDYVEQAEHLRDDMYPAREDTPPGEPADDLAHMEELVTEAAQTYFRMSVANALAVESGSKDPVRVQLRGGFDFEAPPAGYNRKVLAAALGLLETLYATGGRLPEPAEGLMFEELRGLKSGSSPLIEERPALTAAL